MLTATAGSEDEWEAIEVTPYSEPASAPEQLKAAQ